MSEELLNDVFARYSESTVIGDCIFFCLKEVKCRAYKRSTSVMRGKGLKAFMVGDPE